MKIDCEFNKKVFNDYSKVHKIGYQASILCILLREAGLLEETNESQIQYCLFADRAFSSIAGALHLLNYNIGYCGTIQKNGKHLPPFMQVKLHENKHHVSALNKQESMLWESAENKLYCVDYHDTSNVRLISTIPSWHDFIYESQKNRKSKNDNTNQTQSQRQIVTMKQPSVK